MAAFQALLVEGTSGVGKSTLIDALIRRHVNTAEPRRIISLVHLAQSHTYGPLALPEDQGTLTVEQKLQASVQEHTRPWCLVVVDTLHLTHCLRPGVVKWSDVAAFDERMAGLGCKLLFLETSPAAIWELGIVPRTNDEFIRDYAQKVRQLPPGDSPAFCKRANEARRFVLAVGDAQVALEERGYSGKHDRCGIQILGRGLGSGRNICDL